jgi:peptidyl-tRNA hydrolase, PTH1 family
VPLARAPPCIHGPPPCGRAGRGINHLKLFSSTPVDWLIVGLGNPGPGYADSPHNVGFRVAQALAERWDLPKPKKKFAGELAEGRTGPGGPRVAVLRPQTYMNDSGRSVGPARGSYKLDLDRVVVIHDEIDLPFGDVRVRLGGGLAGHNGLKSLRRELGSADFQRVRVGVGRPDTTDPEIVSAHVLGKWREPASEVAALVERARDEVERLVSRRPDSVT